MAMHTLTLGRMEDVADDTRLFVFPKPEGYRFQAGQYVALLVSRLVAPDARGATRSFSIASAPCEAEIYFAMRRSESSFKKTFWQMKPGDTIMISDAVGSFVLSREETRPIVFLAGGIGITPVRSILKQAEHERSTHPFTLFYSNRFLKDAAFYEEMKHLKLPSFRLVTVLTQSEESCGGADEERGYVCEAMLQKHIPDLHAPLYYLVGSPAFIEAMEQMLGALGIGKEQWKKDPFTGLLAQSRAKEAGRTGS